MGVRLTIASACVVLIAAAVAVHRHTVSHMPRTLLAGKTYLETTSDARGARLRITERADPQNPSGSNCTIEGLLRVGATGAYGDKPGGVIRHIHPTTEEYFVVDEGVLAVEVEGNVTRLAPGEGKLVPRGARHQFWNGSLKKPVLFRTTHMPATEVTEVFFETFAGLGQDYGSIGATPVLQLLLTFYHFNIPLANGPAILQSQPVRSIFCLLARALGFSPTYPEYSTVV